MNPTNKAKKIVVYHSSDGSELVPAEVQASVRKEENSSPNEPLADGFTVDDEGLFNNYAVEPDMLNAEYPSPKQQKRYVLLGAAATLFVTFLLWLAFSASQA